MAGNLLMNISQDERESNFPQPQEFQTDLQSDLATAEDRGRSIGREEGRLEGKMERNIEIAHNLRKMGLSIDQIAEATGLTKEELIQATKP